MADTKTRDASQDRTPRDLDTRAQFARPEAWRAPETLPHPDPRPGWAHRYIRLSTLGVADPSNISSKLREGYEPCKAEEYPELMVNWIHYAFNETCESRLKGRNAWSTGQLH